MKKEIDIKNLEKVTGGENTEQKKENAISDNEPKGFAPRGSSDGNGDMAVIPPGAVNVKTAKR